MNLKWRSFSTLGDEVIDKMIRLYSKIEEGVLLHQINKFESIVSRSDLCPEEEFIQCATLRMSKGKTFRPHKHVEKKRTYENQIAQESWVVISGSVRVIFYDLDDSIMTSFVLSRGDASFTFRGGHNYEILEDNTIVYEYKTGPYEGQKIDKVFI